MSKSNRDYVRVAVEKAVFPPGARFENPKDVSTEAATDENIEWAEGVLAHKRDMGDVYAQDFFREFIRRFTAQRAEFAAAQKERDLAEGNRTAAIEVQFKMVKEMERLKAELHRSHDEVARVTKRFDQVQEQAVQLKDEIDKARRDVKEQHIELVELRRRLEAMSPAPASEAKVEELAKWCERHALHSLSVSELLKHGDNMNRIASILRERTVPAPDAELEELATWCSKEDCHCIGCSIKLPRIAALLRQMKRHRIEWWREPFLNDYLTRAGLIGTLACTGGTTTGGIDTTLYEALGRVVVRHASELGIELVERAAEDKEKP